jgi:hypothetical protein
LCLLSRKREGQEGIVNRDEILNWLLEQDNPPVRLLTLTRLLHRPETDARVQDARAHLMDYSVTQGILAHSDTFWRAGGREFWSYKGKHWNTVYLGHFLADGHDPRIARGVEELLRRRGWVGPPFQCMTACLLAAFRRLGYGDHPVVLEETESLAQYLLDHEGLACRAMNPSMLSHCYMALPKLLLCFGEVPPEQRSPAMREAIAWIVQELVAHQVYIYVPGNRKAWQAMRARARKQTDLPEGETRKTWVAREQERFLAEHGLGELEPKASWTRFGFPLNYNSDILEAMVALATVGAPMREALEKPLQVIRDRRTSDGVWILQKSLNSQMWVDVEVKGEPSKWITLYALIVLDHFG